MPAPTIEEFRAHFSPDFPAADTPVDKDDPHGDNGVIYGAPDDRVQAAIRRAMNEYALDDVSGPHRDCLMALIAHRVLVDASDPAGIDSGAGIVTQSGTGSAQVMFNQPSGDPDLQRSKYGREHVRSREALCATW